MKICFPIQSNQGLDSMLSDHFGSAPMFLLVDTSSNETTVISNSDQHHAHGACNPLRAIKGNEVDGLAVRNIGAGAIAHLVRSGLGVYKATGKTVRENLEKLSAGTLTEYSNAQECSGQRHRSGCCH